MSATSRPDAKQPSEGELLAEIDLVTFDCFGTLIDWATALPALGVEPGRMAQFRAESERLQRPSHRDAPFLSYREVLARVGRVLRPELDPVRLASWARSFGELAFFDDTVAGLRLLGGVVDVGVISNCDLVHQIDVERRLGRAWDVCVTAEELGAYKPTDRAWDAAIARVLSRGYELDRWLHVSSWDDDDLLPAGARGVRTAYVPRAAGGSGSASASAPAADAADLRFSDLRELARTVAAAKRGPIAYDVEVEARSAEIAARYHAWMLGEHLGAVRACPGVRAAELLRFDERRFRSTYRFRTRAAYERYLERDAPRLRARAHELFAEDELVFRRSEALVLAST